MKKHVIVNKWMALVIIASLLCIIGLSPISRVYAGDCSYFKDIRNLEYNNLELSNYVGHPVKGSEVKEIQEGLDDLSLIGLDKDNLLSIKITNDNMTYVVKSTDDDCTQAEIIIKEKEKGDIAYVIKEGDLVNTLTIGSDGNYYLDGEKVIYSFSTENINVDGICGSVVDRWQSNDPPKGTSSDYKRVSPDGTVQLNLQKDLEDVGNFALATLIGFAVTGVGILVSTAALIKTIADRHNMGKTNYVKYTYKKYYYKGKHQIGVGLFAEKRAAKYYPGKNATGDYASKTFYCMEQYY
ncbi:hypothetical protein [Aminicella lysinilytica]|jgi:hypothetical protein|uniref:Uncharacterized protein n=1 Tax=Aminicella lysinilytica TaxID=433323 RepID=A0A4R6Q073_9FIRM|nr:hypothetical protein [Aminicella lysinilytica]TDP51852.1 hypothetical protein EV211_12930 [Aminicella lysinilytica]